MHMCSRICKHNYRITIIVRIGYHDHSPAGLVVTGVPLARDDMHSPRATVKHTPCSEITADTSTLNADITVEEVRYAIYDAGKGKATGYDGIPLEVLQNATCINFFVVMFNECFNSGIIPNTWSRGIINPILKDPTTDPRDAMNYRGMTITSIVYKLFCSVLK